LYVTMLKIVEATKYCVAYPKKDKAGRGDITPRSTCIAGRVLYSYS